MSKRSYRQYCALAKTLDVLGERWTLLIVRNLLLGGMRYGRLLETLPGITTNLLAERLKSMTAYGLLAKDGERYVLSETARELETAVKALANWGEQHALGKPNAGDAFDVRWMMTSVWRRAKNTRRTCAAHLQLGESCYVARCGPAFSLREADEGPADGLHYDVEMVVPLGKVADVFIKKVPPGKIRGLTVREHKTGAISTLNTALGLSLR